jgi:hypothetical protein
MNVADAFSRSYERERVDCAGSKDVHSLVLAATKRVVFDKKRAGPWPALDFG